MEQFFEVRAGLFVCPKVERPLYTEGRKVVKKVTKKDTQLFRRKINAKKHLLEKMERSHIAKFT